MTTTLTLFATILACAQINQKQAANPGNLTSPSRPVLNTFTLTIRAAMMSVSAEKRVHVPEISHAQFLFLKSFGKSNTRKFAQFAADTNLPEMTQTAICLALKRLVKTGLISKRDRGVYVIQPAGVMAVDYVRRFYEPHVE